MGITQACKDTAATGMFHRARTLPGGGWGCCPFSKPFALAGRHPAPTFLRGDTPHPLSSSRRLFGFRLASGVHVSVCGGREAARRAPAPQPHLPPCKRVTKGRGGGKEKEEERKRKRKGRGRGEEEREKKPKYPVLDSNQSCQHVELK